ncbi:MAG: hypothetical protein LBL00_03405 [Endomicrobium sp.]|jgi:hypothetical protein|nr:hypothetical protein [Endomicrobium sp.]
MSHNHCYLLDASAFLNYVDPNRSTSTPIIHDIVNEISKGNFYYMPQFCVAEVFNTFAKWRYDKGKIDNNSYNRLCAAFKDMIHDRKVIYAYDLHRYHNINCDKIYATEHTTTRPTTKSYLSTFDILIIAMGIELQKIHGIADVTILSNDKRLINISNLVGVQAQISAYSCDIFMYF